MRSALASRWRLVAPLLLCAAASLSLSLSAFPPSFVVHLSELLTLGTRSPENDRFTNPPLLHGMVVPKAGPVPAYFWSGHDEPKRNELYDSWLANLTAKRPGSVGNVTVLNPPPKDAIWPGCQVWIVSDDQHGTHLQSNCNWKHVGNSITDCCAV